jgi:hypothetical protein
MSNSISNIDDQNRLKVKAELVDTVTGVTAVSAVGTVTNITNMGGIPQAEFGELIANNYYADAIRNKITV